MISLSNNHLSLSQSQNNFHIRPNELKVPTVDEYWLMFQRLLAFEEPAVRCNQMKRLAGRQLPLDGGLNGLSQADQAVLFSTIFGAHGKGAINQIISLQLALAEIERWEEIALASWAKESGYTLAEIEIDTAQVEFLELAGAIAGDCGLSPAQQGWLEHAVLSAPNWSMLSQAGPWRDDARASLLSDFMQSDPIKDFQSNGSRAREEARVFFGKLIEERQWSLPDDFLPRAVLIVEGQTEALLVPQFARLLEADLIKRAVMVIAAGGAKQVVKRFLEMRDILALPIIVLLDGDAKEEAEILHDMLRDDDRLLVLESGEIEDSFDQDVFVRLINQHLSIEPSAPNPVAQGDFKPGVSRTRVLSRLWRDRQLGDFDKVAFAEFVAKTIDRSDDVPNEIRKLVKAVYEVTSNNHD